MANPKIVVPGPWDTKTPKIVKISKSLFRYFAACINLINHEESPDSLKSVLRAPGLKVLLKRSRDRRNYPNLFLKKPLSPESQNFLYFVFSRKG